MKTRKIAGCIVAIVLAAHVDMASAQGPRPTTGPNQQGSSSADPPPTSYQAPTIVRMLADGGAIELVGSTKNQGLRAHFVAYMVGFAFSAERKCKLLPEEVVRFLPAFVTEAKDEIAQAKPNEKAAAELRYRSVAYGFNDGTLFVTRNACGDEPAKKAMETLAELFKLFLKKN